MDWFTKTRCPEPKRLRGAPLLLGLGLALTLLSGCSAVPSIYIAGSYFPAWLLSAVIAIVLTVLIRVAFIRIGIDDVLPLRLLVYVCTMLALTFATLLLFFE